jgi:chaperonin GroES
MAKAITSKNTVKFLPTAGYILIEPEELQTKTTGGIYLPETATGEKPQKGKVLAIGEDQVMDNGSKRKSPVKVNDIVIYKKWGGNEVKENNKEYMFVKFEDILAIVK